MYKNLKITAGIQSLLYAHHQNFIGTEVDEKMHSHLWNVTIEAKHNRLDKNDVLFNFKKTSSFIYDLLEDKNLNDILENKEKYIDKKLLSYVKDISANPTNEVLTIFIKLLVEGKIVEDQPCMKGIEVMARIDKEDGMKENYKIDKKKNKGLVIIDTYTIVENENYEIF